MSTHKYIDRVCVAVLVFALVLTVLFMNGRALGISLVVDEDAEAHSDDTYFTSNDLNAEWDRQAATIITLNGSSATVSGSGAYVNKGSVYISSSGYYTVSGTLQDGSLVVDANKNSKVWIELDGVSIDCSNDACIRVDEADKVFLTLADGSQNTLISGATYSQTALADGTDGAIFAHDDLTINGSGSLSVTAQYKHGIAANDDLVITGGGITVTASADAIRANDSLRITEATITVTAGDDGLVVAGTSTGEGDEVEEGSGWLYIRSGTFSITSADDGVHTAGDVTIDGGVFAIDAGDDGIHSDSAIYLHDGEMVVTDCYEGIEAVVIEMTGGDVSIYPSDDGFNANGGSGQMGGPWGRNPQGAATEEEETYIKITGGNLTIVNETAQDADGLDSNGSIYISGGTVRISLPGSGSNSAIDYGSESGGVCEISGGTVIACGSSTMAEAFDSSSTQCSVLYNLSTVDAGAEVALKDADGNLLLSYTVPCSFSSMNLSCPDMQLGQTYTLVIDGNTYEITLDEVVTTFGEQGFEPGFGQNFDQGGAPGDMFGEKGDAPQPPDGDFEMGEPPEGDPEMREPPGDRPDMGEAPEGKPDMGEEPPSRGEGPTK